MSTCEGCSLPISGNAKSLSIGGKTFHAACFVCSKCTSSLINAQVAEVNGEFLCGPCLEQVKSEMAAQQARQPQRAAPAAATPKTAAPPQAAPQKAQAPAPKQPAASSAPLCSICNTNLSGRVVGLNGKQIHLTCFKCTQCQSQIEGGYGEINGQIVCPKCVEQAQRQHQLQQQQQQQQQIQQQQQRVQQASQQQTQQEQQEETVVCFSCKKNVSGEYSEFKGQPYCEPCAIELQKATIARQSEENAEAPRCAGCNGALFGAYKKVMGGLWHPLCFVCAHCRQPLPGEFKEANGKPYCDEHYGQLFAKFKCHKCQQPIRAGDYVDLDDQQYHKDCFKCAKCGGEFKDGKFKTVGKDFICEPCFVR
eukprot:TRINITY_DN227_c0_g1_i1.p1 TRINITY_DN227_c0_g1~~TRINITY_DN227_c0_g1_i1.p1  ORF type:complete len:365 (-),score=90.30 TRINITY_DN227_c0_g1_i1:65-1159(-)